MAFEKNIIVCRVCAMHEKCLKLKGLPPCALVADNSMYIVATVVHKEKGQTPLFGDILLITPDLSHAKTVAYHVKEHRPIPGLNYDELVTFDDVIYFERKMNMIGVKRDG